MRSRYGIRYFRAAKFGSIVLCFPLLFLFLFQNSNAFALENPAFTPFFISNTLPVSQGLGLPNTLSSESLKPGENRFDFNIGIKSNANDAGNENGEQLILDGETHAMEIGWRYGLNESWQLDGQFAYLSHNKGYFDSMIQNWHEVFQLDEGDRPTFDNDELLYSYTDGSSGQQLTEAVSGLGDMRLGLAYEFDQQSVDNLLFRVGLTLPTGDQSKLTGSEKIDADIGVYMANQGFGDWQNLAWHVNLGYVLIGDDFSFGIQTQNGMWFGSIGGYLGFNQAVTFKAQLDFHGTMFESEIDELNKPAVQLTLGMSYKTQKDTIATVYFSEDITVNRGADFSLGLQFQFGL